MAIRLSGLTSGMDTDAIVQELVSAYSMKTEKYEKQQTKLTWKQDAWKGLNTKIYGLYTNVSNLRYSSAYSLRKTTVSDNTKASVTASSDAVTGTQKLNILQTAQASYITGGKLGDDVTKETKMSELGYKGGDTSFTVEDGNGKSHEIKITKTTTVNEVLTQLKEAGLNASFDENNKRIFVSAKESGAKADFNLIAGNADGNDVLGKLGLTTALIDDKGNFINGAVKYQEAYKIFEEAAAAGKTAEAYIKDLVAAYQSNEELIQNYEKSEKQLEARKAYDAVFKALEDKNLMDHEVTDADGNVTRAGFTDTQLEDMIKTVYADGALLKSELNTYITDKGIEGVDTQELYNTLAKQMDNMETVYGYSKKYDDITTVETDVIEAGMDRAAYDAAKEANKNNQFAYLVKENTTPEKLEVAINHLINDINMAEDIKTNPSKYNAGAAVKITGQDAKITLNNVEYTSNSNSFSINGLTIQAQAVTGEGLENAISITTNVDTQGIYDKIKDFLTEYNNVINEMTKLYNADSAKDYEPLTDEEREAMSDEQIEKWETKIKDSLLRRDGTLNSIISGMVNAMATSYEVNGVKVSLSTFGISTLGFLNAAENENYAYHIDGDEDDEVTSGKKDKLMKAIEEDPDQILEFMKKLTSGLYSAVDEKMKSTELSSAYKVYNDKEMDSEAKNIASMIKKWEEKIKDKEDYYFDKFSQMEVALSKLQNSTSSISGLLGQ